MIQKITINGGHCVKDNTDPGAVGPTGLQEAVVAFDLMHRVAVFLRAVGYTVLEIQEDSLSDIADMSNEFGADLFVSIHCNSASSSAAHGTETFCYQLGGVGEKLAVCIQNQLISTLKTTDRGIKTANFAVLRLTDCPATLVEVAFINNVEEEKMLANPEKRRDIAAAIARGVTDYIASTKL